MSSQISSWMFYLTQLLPIIAQNIAVYDENYFICIADENSTIFFAPPRKQKDTSTYILAENDWITKNSTMSHFGPVIDKRWEDFPVIHESSIEITMEHSVALSIYTKGIYQAVFAMTNEWFLEMTEMDLNKHEQLWVHYHVIIKNRNTYLYENNNLVTYITNFSPDILEVRANNATYWKIHSYTWQFSHTASTEWTRINVSDSCLVVYASTCPYCSMNVSTSTGEKYSLSSEDDGITRTWTRQILLFGNGNDNYVDIFRTTHGHSTHGFWGLDIRKCPKVTDGEKAIFEKFSYEKLAEETFCYTLHNQKSHAPEFKSVDCEPGRLGNKCETTCQEILDNKYCEKMKVCYDQSCKCAWGYSGKYCQEECENGKWGVDCGNNCTDCLVCDKITGGCPVFPKELTDLTECDRGRWGIDCENNCTSCTICDTQTGNCLDQHLSLSDVSNFSVLFIVIAIVTLLIFLKLVFYVVYKHQKYLKYRLASTNRIPRSNCPNDIQN